MRKGLLFRATVALLALLPALFTCAVPALAENHEPDRQQKILAGWFEEWSIYYANYNLANLESNGSAAKLSHLIYAFGNVSASVSNPSSDTCVIADAWADFENNNLPPVGGIASTWPLFGNFAEILKLKQLHPGLNTVISLGGASAVATQAFSTAASTQAGRHALAASCINMFITGNVGSDWNGNITAPGLFDGINIDWEFPAAADKQNFTLFLQEFRSQLDALGATTGKHYSLSFDGPAGSQNYTNIDLKAAASQVDFITIDGYNYAGTWDSTTNHASPLFDRRQNPDFGQGLDINDTVAPISRPACPRISTSWASHSTALDGPECPTSTTASTRPPPDPPSSHSPMEPASALISAATPPDATPCSPPASPPTPPSPLSGANGYGTYYDPRRMAVSLYNPTSHTFYSYDNPDTAFIKSLYIDLRVPGGLGGAFVWALKDDDANGTMVKTLATGLGR